MKNIKKLIISAAFVLGLGVFALPAAPVSAINVFEGCGGSGSTAVCKAANEDNANSLAKNIINTMLYIIGILAVIMIVFGAIRYTASAGDASRVKAAKETIMYAVVGLVVAIFAFAIVNFVVTRI
jgi:heme/copper-type cytochrome/quinol oxidase subunit 2